MSFLKGRSDWELLVNTELPIVPAFCGAGGDEPCGDGYPLMCEDPIPTDSAPSGGGLTDSTPTESDDDPTPVISAPEQLLTCPDLHGCMNNGYSLWGTNEPALKEYLQQCISNFLDLADSGDPLRARATTMATEILSYGPFYVRDDGADTPVASNFIFNNSDAVCIPSTPATIEFLKVGSGFVVNVTNAGGVYWNVDVTSEETGSPSNYGSAIGPDLKIVHEGGTLHHGYSRGTSTIKVREGRYAIAGINYPDRSPGTITQGGKYLSLGDSHSSNEDGYVRLGTTVTFAGFIT